MSFTRFPALLFLALPALAADMPLPELRIEPVGGGSVFFIKNNSDQALKAYLIELVDYPGSSYSFWQDEMVAEPIPPKGEKRIQVTNMTVGAVPDYVKMQAALYAGGGTAGVPERVTALVDRRRAQLETVREVISRLEKGETAANLRQWADSMPPPAKGKQNTQAAINQAAAKGVILGILGKVQTGEALGILHAWEKAMQ